MGFVNFMSSTAGRVARIVVGIVLIIIGALTGGAGWIIAVIGLVPLLAGLFDVCLFAPLLKQPMSGKEIRAKSS
jgi:hypothetical protein